MRGRAVMIGDAAHLASPIPGASARMALRDALALAECLAQPGELRGALEAFEERRLPEGTLVVENGRRWRPA